MQNRVGAGWAVVLFAALAGCSSGEGGGPVMPSGSGGSDGPSFGFAGAPQVPSCTEGASCSCGDGRTGELVCSPTESCNCEACEDFTPDMPAKFTTCAGNVFGDWLLDSAKFELAPLSFRNELNQTLGGCPAQLLNAPKSYDVRLAIPLTGLTRFSLSKLAVDARFESECGERALDVPCGQTRLGGGTSCSEVGCGICECNTGWPALADEGAVLDLDNTTLSLRSDFTSTAQLLAQFDYCAAGERLTLHATGLEFSLRRVAFAGKAVECSMRSLAECDNDVTGGCQVVGTACTGTAISCRIQDYGVVPGCVVYEAGAVCASATTEPKTCADFAGAGCVAQAGCKLANVCSGPALDCETNWIATASCDTDVGCVKTSTSCFGTGDCAKQKTQNLCKPSHQCEWITDCVGTLTPCSDFSLTDCEDHAGCFVSGKAN